MPDMMRYDLAPLANPLTDSEAADLVLEGSAGMRLPRICGLRRIGMTEEFTMRLTCCREMWSIILILTQIPGTIVSWSQELTDRSLYAGMSNSDGGYDRGAS